MPLADDLGVALQLTNILRDVREDLENGRIYLPAEDLRRFGCARADLQRAAGRAAELVRFEAARAASGSPAAWAAAAPRRRSGPACWRWPASTGGSSSRIEADPLRSCAGASRCRRGRRRGCAAPQRSRGRGA